MAKFLETIVIGSQAAWNSCTLSNTVSEATGLNLDTGEYTGAAVVDWDLSTITELLNQIYLSWTADLPGTSVLEVDIRFSYDNSVSWTAWSTVTESTAVEFNTDLIDISFIAIQTRVALTVSDLSDVIEVQSLSADLYFSGNIALADTVTLTDESSLSANIVASDSLTLSDQISFGIDPLTYILNLSDTMTLSDEFNRQWSGFITFDDTLALTDVFSQAGGNVRSAMTDVLAAVYTRALGTDFLSLLGGRLYKRTVPLNASGVFPYCIFRVITSNPRDTFTEKLEDMILQFSILSSKEDTEIDTLFDNLIYLYDDCELDLLYGECLWMQRTTTILFPEEIVTKEGTVLVQHCAVDYSILTERR